MRIDTPSPTPRPGHTRYDPVDRPGHDRSPSWEAVARRTAAVRADVLPAAATRLAAASAIGDAAVGFDARPIVAPVAEDSPTIPIAEAMAAATPAAKPVPAANADAAAVTAPTLPPVDIARPTPGTIRLPDLDRSAGIAPSIEPPAGPALPLPAAARAIETNGLALPVRGADRAPSATIARAAQAPAPRVFASAEDVRIVVRDLTLTDDDRSALVRIAEETLAGTRFAGRPIRVIDRAKG